MNVREEDSFCYACWNKLTNSLFIIYTYIFIINGIIMSNLGFTAFIVIKAEK